MGLPNATHNGNSQFLHEDRTFSFCLIVRNQMNLCKNYKANNCGNRNMYAMMSNINNCYFKIMRVTTRIRDDDGVENQFP